MSRHPLLGLRLCFPIMPSMPAGWFKQAVFFFSLSIIPCPAAAPYTLHTRRDESYERIDLILAFNGCFSILAYWYCHCFIIIYFLKKLLLLHMFCIKYPNRGNGKMSTSRIRIEGGGWVDLVWTLRQLRNTLYISKYSSSSFQCLLIATISEDWSFHFFTHQNSFSWVRLRLPPCPTADRHGSRARIERVT